jgi:hypothetical protein
VRVGKRSVRVAHDVGVHVLAETEADREPARVRVRIVVRKERNAGRVREPHGHRCRRTRDVRRLGQRSSAPRGSERPSEHRSLCVRRAKAGVLSEDPRQLVDQVRRQGDQLFVVGQWHRPSSSDGLRDYQSDRDAYRKAASNAPSSSFVTRGEQRSRHPLQQTSETDTSATRSHARSFRAASFDHSGFRGASAATHPKHAPPLWVRGALRSAKRAATARERLKRLELGVANDALRRREIARRPSNDPRAKGILSP